jgi:hypothetical protein
METESPVKTTTKSTEQNISYDNKQVYEIKIFHMTTTKSVKSEYFKRRQPSLWNENFHKMTIKSMKVKFFCKMTTKSTEMEFPVKQSSPWKQNSFHEIATKNIWNTILHMTTTKSME